MGERSSLSAWWCRYYANERSGNNWRSVETVLLANVSSYFRHTNSRQPFINFPAPDYSEVGHVLRNLQLCRVMRVRAKGEL